MVYGVSVIAGRSGKRRILHPPGKRGNFVAAVQVERHPLLASFVLDLQAAQP
ncbi:MAG: hypothetical protein ACYC3I_12930 [Gemmataceae bacterium]